jgi:hypothetical protein
MNSHVYHSISQSCSVFLGGSSCGFLGSGGRGFLGGGGFPGGGALLATRTRRALVTGPDNWHGVTLRLAAARALAAGAAAAQDDEPRRRLL